MAIISTTTADGSVPSGFSDLNAAYAGACATTVRRIAWVTLALGGAILLGWAFNITVLKSGMMGLTATQPMTAVCLILSAAALGFSTYDSVLARWSLRLGAGAVMLICAAVLIQNALDADWGMDRWLFARAILQEQTGPFLRAGRPAGAAALGFFMIGWSLLILPFDGKWARRTHVFCTTLGAIVIIALAVAYGFGLKSLYVMGMYVQVGLVTTLGMGLLFAGLLVRRADIGPMKYLCGNSIGAASTRRLLSWTLAVLIVLVGIVQFGTRASWYRSELEIALVTLAGIGVLIAGLLSHARRIDSLEQTGRGIARRELQTAQALADSQERKAEFLSKLAHELRNPLSPLRNGLQILRKQTDDDARLKPTVEMMERQLKGLSQAIDTLLDEYEKEPKK